MRVGFTGKTVVDGRVRFWSVTAMEKGDPRSQGCAIKWYREKVLGDKPPISEANQAKMDKGTKLHDDVVAYLTTGSHAVDPLILKGAHFMPPPGSPLTLEKGFHTVTFPNYVTALPEITSPLTASGIPFVGYVDCGHSMGINFGAEDPSDMYDPPGTVEVIDWKRKGNAYDKRKNPLWKRPEELIMTIQMVGYGEMIRRTTPGVEHVRLSHGNFFEKGSPPRKITKRHTVREIENAWQYPESLARILVDVAREPDIEKVPGNMKACGAFGGCPYADTCHAYKKHSMDTLYSDGGSVVKDFETMGLLGTIPMNQPPATPAPLPAPQGSLLAQATDPRAAILAEEAALRAAQPAQQALPTSLLDAWNVLLSHGRGMPGLAGEAGKAYAQANHYQWNGGGYAGGGALSGITLHDPADIFQLTNELEESVGRPARFPVIRNAAPAPAPVAPPPVVATVPVGPIGPGIPVEMPPVHAAAGGLLPPGAPPSLPNLAAANPIGVPTPVAQPETAEQTEEKAKRGRPKRQKLEDPNPHLAQAPSGAVPSSQIAALMAAPGVSPTAQPTTPFVAPQVSHVGTVPTFPAGGYRVFINCRPEFPTTNLAGFVEHINAQLSKMYCVDNQGRPTIQDVRAAPKDSAIGFTGWRGATRDVAISAPPAPGDYHLDTFGDDLKEIVADAFRTVCERTGGLYVRGLGGR